MLYRILIIIQMGIGLGLQSGTGYCQFSEKEQTEIRKKARKLIFDYENRMNILGNELNSIDKTRINIEALINLFVNRSTEVYNDLDPEHKLSPAYEIETYASNIALWYPKGLKVKISYDNAQVSNIISHREEVYSIDFVVDKYMNGSYLGKSVTQNSERILIRIGFVYSSGLLQSFKIAGIKSAAQQASIDDEKIIAVRSIQFQPDQEREINKETRTLLNDYANYLSLIGDTAENIEDKIMYKESFRTLFVSNNSLVNNDILFDARKSTDISVYKYITLYSEAYASEGGKVDFSFDSVFWGYIVKHSDSLYYRVAEVNKTFEGNYLGKRKVTYKERISIRIEFKFKNGVFKNFLIDKIEAVLKNRNEAETRIYSDIENKNAAIQKSDATGTTKKSEKIKIIPDSPSKINLILGSEMGLSNIYNPNMVALTIPQNAHVWQITPMLGYNVYINYTFMISPRLGLFTGVSYSSNATKFSLNSNVGRDTVFHDKVNYTDINMDIYHKLIKARYDSALTIHIIYIPMGLVFSIPITRRIQFELKPSINFGILYKASAATSGYINYSGYYPYQKFQIFKYINWPELGFTQYSTNKNVNVKGKLSEFYINASLSAGITLPVNKKVNMSLMGNLTSGLTNLNKDNVKYVDIFGQTEPDKSKVSTHVFPYKTNRIINFNIVIEFVLKL